MSTENAQERQKAIYEIAEQVRYDLIKLGTNAHWEDEEAVIVLGIEKALANFQATHSKLEEEKEMLEIENKRLGNELGKILSEVFEQRTPTRQELDLANDELGKLRSLDDAALVDFTQKVHEALEGRYELTGVDLHSIHSFLADHENCAATLSKLEEEKEKLKAEVEERVQIYHNTVSQFSRKNSTLTAENERLREAVVRDNRLRTLIREHIGMLDARTPFEKNLLELAERVDSLTASLKGEK